MILPGADGPVEIRAEVRQGLYAKYQYKGIDVQRELALMALWLEKNKRSRPKNMLRFVENWLRKCNGGAAIRKDAGPFRSTVKTAPTSTPSPASPTDATSLASALVAATPTTRIHGPQELSAVFARMKLIVNHRSK